MIRRCLQATLRVFLLAPLWAGTSPQDAQRLTWPGFRGPRASGVAEGYATPTTWNLKDSANVLWKVAIPGLAHSSPIVWGDSLFLTTSISEQGDDPLRVGLYGDIEPVNDASTHRWCVYRLDKKSGRILWARTARQGVPKVKRHPKSSHANPRTW